MYYVAVLIPLFLSVILFLFFPKKVVLWEYLLLIGVSLISYLILSSVMTYNNTSDEEYLGDVGIKVVYYEPWDEYIYQICTRSCCCDSKGENCSTETYDCSYVKRHSPEWVLIDSKGSSWSISKQYYNELVNRWGGNKIFVDMHRDYHSYDGDSYETNWDRKETTTAGVAWSHNYENRTQSAHTLFKFKELDKEEIKEKGLYDYPKFTDKRQQPTILGYRVPDTVKYKYDYLNGVLGPQKQVRLFILYFWDKPREVAFDQKDYWQGGNKNEIVICVGINKKSKKVEWVEGFSWCDNPYVESQVKTWFAYNPNFNLNALYPEITKFISQGYKRKSFKDFDYISIELSELQIKVVWIFLLIINVACSIYVVKNEIENYG